MESNNAIRIAKEKLAFETFCNTHNIKIANDFTHFIDNDDDKGDFLNNGIYYELKEISPRSYIKNINFNDFDSTWETPKYEDNNAATEILPSNFVTESECRISHQSIQQLITKSWDKKKDNLQRNDKCALILWYNVARQTDSARVILTVNEAYDYNKGGFNGLYFVKIPELLAGAGY